MPSNRERINDSRNRMKISLHFFSKYFKATNESYVFLIYWKLFLLRLKLSFNHDFCLVAAVHCSRCIIIAWHFFPKVEMSYLMTQQSQKCWMSWSKNETFSWLIKGWVKCVYMKSHFFMFLSSAFWVQACMCMLCLRSKSGEGYIVYCHSKLKVFHCPFLLLVYVFLVLPGWGANSIICGVLKWCSDLI